MAPARSWCRPYLAPARTPAWSRTARAVLVLLASTLASLPVARAAEPDVASLEREVAVLKDVVRRLQARVDRLEGQASAAESAASGPPASPARHASDADALAAAASLPPPPIAALQLGTDAPAPSPQAQLRANWSMIRQGIGADEVSRLLGAPTSRLRLDGRTAWYYSYPTLGKGSVFFTDAGRVSSHQSPFAWGG